MNECIERGTVESATVELEQGAPARNSWSGNPPAAKTSTRKRDPLAKDENLAKIDSVLVSTSHPRDRFVSWQLPGTVWIGSKPVEAVRRLGTGVPALDSWLDGGLPRGGLSEIVGGPTSGCTSLAHRLVASATGRGEVVAIVDLPDALHPAALYSAGADLDRVLWVRPPSLPASLKSTELILDVGGFGVVILDLGSFSTAKLPLHVWPRLSRRAKQTGTVLAVLAPHRVAGSFAILSLQLMQQRVRWEKGLFAGVTVQLCLARSRIAARRALQIGLGIED